MANVQDDGVGRAPTCWSAVLVVAGAALMILLNAGGRAFGVRDVVRYAQMAFEMRHAGTVVPTLGGEPYHEAMPLAAWLPLGVASLQGHVTPLAARVFPGLAGVAMVAVVILLAARHGSRREAVIAGAFAALNALVIEYSRGSRIDTVLAFAVAVAIGSFFHAALSGRLRWFAVSGVGLALAVAAKGPMAVALVASALVPWLAWERRWSALFRGTGIVAAVAIPCTLGWLLPYIRVLGPEGSRAFFDQMFLMETVSEVVDGYGKAAPPWQYVLDASTHFAPWVVASVVGGWCVARNSKSSRPLDRMALCWSVVPFLLLSLATGKSARYLLPLIPGMALLGAPVANRWLAAMIERRARGLERALVVLGFVLGGTTLASPFLPFSRGAPAPYLWGTALLGTVAGAVTIVAALRGRTLRSIAGAYAATSALVALVYSAALVTPAVEGKLAIRRFEDAVTAALPSGEELAVDEGSARGRPRGLDRYELGLYMGQWVPRGDANDVSLPYVLALAPVAGRQVLATIPWRDGRQSWSLLGPPSGGVAR